MPKGKPTALGHIPFRRDEELHRKLAEVAEVLGNDVSGILRQMIVQQLPEWYEKATALKRKLIEAEAAYDQACKHMLR